MFERFTRDARRVVELAEREAAGAGGPIDSEHLLLGVARADGPGARALASLGVTAEDARDAIERLLVADLAAVGVSVERLPSACGGGGSSTRKIAPRARKVLEQALREALARKDRHIGTEHILLALLDLEDGTGVLAGLGVDRARAEADVTAAVAAATEQG